MRLVLQLSLGDDGSHHKFSEVLDQITTPGSNFGWSAKPLPLSAHLSSDGEQLEQCRRAEMATPVVAKKDIDNSPEGSSRLCNERLQNEMDALGMSHGFPQEINVDGISSFCHKDSGNGAGPSASGSDALKLRRFAKLMDNAVKFRSSLSEDISVARLHSSILCEPMERSSKQLDLITRFLKETERFSEIETSVLRACARSMEGVELGESEFVYCQGDDPDAFYVIVAGAVQEWQQAEPSPLMQSLGSRGPGRRPSKRMSIMHVRELGPSDAFGDLEVLNDHVRESTMQCKSPCLLLRLPAETFRDILDGKLSSAFKNDIEKVKQVPAFRNIPDNVLAGFIFCFRDAFFSPGDAILIQGNIPQATSGEVMWILSGKAVSCIDPCYSHEHPKEPPATMPDRTIRLSEHNAGDVIGDTSIVVPQVTRSVTALTNIVAIGITVGNLQKRFPPELLSSMEMAAKAKLVYERERCIQALEHSSYVIPTVETWGDRDLIGQLRTRHGTKRSKAATSQHLDGTNAATAIVYSHRVKAGYGLWRLQQTRPVLHAETVCGSAHEYEQGRPVMEHASLSTYEIDGSRKLKASDSTCNESFLSLPDHAISTSVFSFAASVPRSFTAQSCADDRQCESNVQADAGEDIRQMLEHLPSPSFCKDNSRDGFSIFHHERRSLPPMAGKHMKRGVRPGDSPVEQRQPLPHRGGLRSASHDEKLELLPPLSRPVDLSSTWPARRVRSEDRSESRHLLPWGMAFQCRGAKSRAEGRHESRTTMDLTLTAPLPRRSGDESCSVVKEIGRRFDEMEHHCRNRAAASRWEWCDSASHGSGVGALPDAGRNMSLWDSSSAAQTTGLPQLGNETRQLIKAAKAARRSRAALTEGQGQAGHPERPGHGQEPLLPFWKSLADLDASVKANTTNTQNARLARC